jgi:hypothetical protein
LRKQTRRSLCRKERERGEKKVCEFAHLCVRAERSRRGVKVVVAIALLFWNKLREIAAEPPRANKSARA